MEVLTNGGLFAVWMEPVPIVSKVLLLKELMMITLDVPKSLHTKMKSLNQMNQINLLLSKKRKLYKYSRCLFNQLLLLTVNMILTLNSMVQIGSVIAKKDFNKAQSIYLLLKP